MYIFPSISIYTQRGYTTQHRTQHCIYILCPLYILFIHTLYVIYNIYFHVYTYANITIVHPHIKYKTEIQTILVKRIYQNIHIERIFFFCFSSTIYIFTYTTFIYICEITLKCIVYGLDTLLHIPSILYF